MLARMPTTESATASPRAPLSNATRLGPASLIVTDLDRSVDFYVRAIGLRVHRRHSGTAALGGGREDLLVLVEERDARPAGRHAGLYHVALLHSSRLELARAAQRLALTRTPIQGASDHGISEAIYLADPDGNGLELAADRPRVEWPDHGGAGAMPAPAPLDVLGLLGLVEHDEPTDAIDAGTVIGHVHLHVGNVEDSLRLYRDVLGFEVMNRFSNVAFVSAAGYHHHVGINTWRGAGVPPVPPATVGLRRWTLVVDPSDAAAIATRATAAGLDTTARDGGIELRDPSGNAVLVLAQAPAENGEER
jgi:catechol 2,3-dioxygenase